MPMITRSDAGFLLAVIEAAIREGATTINIPDTVAYAIPLSLESSFVLSAKNQGTRKSNIERPLA